MGIHFNSRVPLEYIPPCTVQVVVAQDTDWPAEHGSYVHTYMISIIRTLIIRDY